MLNSAKNAAMDKHRASPSLTTFGSSTPGALGQYQFMVQAAGLAAGFFEFDFNMPEIELLKLILEGLP